VPVPPLSLLPPGFTPIGTIVGHLLEIATLPQTHLSGLTDHAQLLQLITNRPILSGDFVNAGIPTSQAVTARINELGLIPPSSLARRFDNDPAERIAFDAGVRLCEQRVSAAPLHVSARYILPDESVVRAKRARILDQLWISADTFRPTQLRLIGLQLDTNSTGQPSSNRDDETAEELGYDVIHVSTAWVRVDPRRSLLAVLELGGLTVLDKFRQSSPGNRIKDYTCAACGGPMIRNAEGYGIVDDDGRFVHEECFDR